MGRDQQGTHSDLQGQSEVDPTAAERSAAQTDEQARQIKTTIGPIETRRPRALKRHGVVAFCLLAAAARGKAAVTIVHAGPSDFKHAKVDGPRLVAFEKGLFS